MKRLIQFFIIFFLFLNISLSGQQQPLQDDAELKHFSSEDMRFKFSVSYPAGKWLFSRDIKQQRNSRFKDLLIINTSDLVNQVRISTYSGLDSPNAKGVSRLLEAEFVQWEIKRGEQYMKVRDLPMPVSIAQKANAHEGWIMSFSYHDRREGTLYNTYWIFYKKSTFPAERAGAEPVIIGKAYIVRFLVRENQFNTLIKDILKVINSFKFIS